MPGYRILPGLPATGPWPEQFSKTGRGTHLEGFVVEVSPAGKPTWVGNFQPGVTSYSGVTPHPGGKLIIVIAGGQAYVIDPKERRLLTIFGGELETVLIVDSGLIVIGNGIWLEAWDDSRMRWRTRRISWDGMWDLRVESDRLKGESWSAIDELDYSFSVDLRTGQVEGGSYDGPPDFGID